MTYFISDTTVDYYDAEKFAKVNCVRFLTMKEALALTELEGVPAGPFWTRTRISCSTQLVWKIVSGSVEVMKFDKTFTAFMFGVQL